MVTATTQPGTEGRSDGLLGHRPPGDQDVRVLTGLLAGELVALADDPTPRFDASHRAAEAHRATLRSDEFAFHTALAMRALDRATRPD
jgi:hypothetical protein